jgi:hypothetical protein
VDQGGDALLMAADAPQGGAYLHVDKWMPASAAGRDAALAKALWDVSEALVDEALRRAR